MPRNTRFSGEITYTDEDEDGNEIEYTIRYEGVYEPACNRGHIDNWTPDESWLSILNLPPSLASIEDRIQAKCWEDFHDNN